jgi:hypothetical protein
MQPVYERLEREPVPCRSRAAGYLQRMSAKAGSSPRRISNRPPDGFTKAVNAEFCVWIMADESSRAVRHQSKKSPQGLQGTEGLNLIFGVQVGT